MEDDSHYYGGGYAWRPAKKKRKEVELSEMKSETAKAVEKVKN